MSNEKSEEFPWKYMGFFWPLSLMGVAMLAGRLAQNFVLLGYDEGVRELAWYALALAMLGPFLSILGMTPQMVTVMARDRRSRRTTLRFTLTICVILCAPLHLLAWLPPGATLVEKIYGVSSQGSHVIVLYLRFFAPLIFVGGIRQWSMGLLVREKRTGWVTGLKAMDVALVVGVLALGIANKLPPVVTIAMSGIVSQVAVVVITLILVSRLKLRDEEQAEHVDFRRLLVYFLPLATTTFMFTISRPIIFWFVTNLSLTGHNSNVLVAAISLAFTCNMMFQVTVNQFRHLMTRFADKDPDGVRRFMTATTLVVSSLLLLVILTPIARLFLTHLQGAKGITLSMALQALWVLIPVPAIIAWRNYYHGLALVHRHTGSMAAASVVRNLSIIVFGALFASWGILNHATGASLLVIAFAAEATSAYLLTRGWRIELRNASACQTG